MCARTRDNQAPIFITPDFMLSPESVALSTSPVMYRWIDDPSTMTFETVSGQLTDNVLTWTDTVSGRSMSRLSKPVYEHAQGVRIDGRAGFQLTSGNRISGFRAFAAITYWRDCSSTNWYQFPVLTSDTTYEYCGGQKGQSVASTVYADPVVLASRIYNRSGYLGMASAVSNLHWWDKWEIFIMTNQNVLPSFNRFGLDRNFHEFSGSLKEIMFFSVPLHTNTALLGSVLAYFTSCLPL